MANATLQAMWGWTGQGSLPVVVDASSCSVGLADEMVPSLTEENQARHEKLEILDSIAWAADHLLPKLGHLEAQYLQLRAYGATCFLGFGRDASVNGDGHGATSSSSSSASRMG